MSGGFKTANGKSINVKEESLKFVKEKIFEKTDETEPINLNLGKSFFSTSNLYCFLIDGIMSISSFII